MYKLTCDPFEDVVDLLVPAVATVPHFDDTLVVSVNEKGGTRLNDAEKSTGKELEAHCFCPANVASIAVPPQLQCPGMPAPLQVNSNADR